MLIKLKNNSLRTSLLILLLIITFFGNAQYQIGMTTGKFAGIDALEINPALMFYTPKAINIKIASGQSFFQNNYVSVPNGHLFSLLKKDFFNTLNNENLNDRYTMVDKDGFMNTSIGLPSFSIRFDNLNIAYTNSIKSVFSFYNVPYHVAKFVFDGTDYRPQQGILYTADHYEFNLLAFQENAIYLSSGIARRKNMHISYGMGVKYLNGLSLLCLDNEQSIYNVVHDDQLQIDNFDADIAFSLPIDYETNEFNSSPLIRGSGIAFDIGIDIFKGYWDDYYTKRKYNYEPENPFDYRYRFGMSIKNIGFIKFNKDTEHHRVNNQSATWNGIESFRYENLNQFTSAISQEFNQNQYGTFYDDQFSMSLPTTLQLYLDYHHKEDYYIHFLFVNNLNLGQHFVKSPSLLAITPRYETSKMTVSVPLLLHQYKYMGMGLSLRYKYFTIGTDRLLKSTGITEFYGYDIYASIKIGFDPKRTSIKDQTQCPDTW